MPVASTQSGLDLDTRQPIFKPEWFCDEPGCTDRAYYIYSHPMPEGTYCSKHALQWEQQQRGKQ